MKVLGFGALNVDFIYEVEDLTFLKLKGLEIEPGMEVVLNGSLLLEFSDKLTRYGTLKKISPGGSAANTCHMLSLMGISTSLLGVVGLDKEGEYYLGKMDEESKKMVIRRGKTGITYIINEKNRELEVSDRAIVVVPNSNSDLTKKDVDLEKLSPFFWVHMSSFVSDSALRAQIHVKEAFFGKKRFSIDPGEIYAKKGEILFDLIDGMDILFCSEKELHMLFGMDTESSLKVALSLVKMVVIKKGSKGASLYLREKAYHAKGKKVLPCDTTGAGDVLDGVFLGLFLKGHDLPYALEKAVFAASESIKGYGRDSYPKDVA